MSEPEDKFSFYAFIIKFFSIGIFVPLLVVEFSGVVLKKKEILKQSGLWRFETRSKTHRRLKKNADFNYTVGH